MLIIIITVLFCVAQNLMREASAFLLGIEPTAALLSLSTFVLIVSRVWSVARMESLRQRHINHSGG